MCLLIFNATKSQNIILYNLFKSRTWRVSTCRVPTRQHSTVRAGPAKALPDRLNSFAPLNNTYCDVSFWNVIPDVLTNLRDATPFRIYSPGYVAHPTTRKKQTDLNQFEKKGKNKAWSGIILYVTTNFIFQSEIFKFERGMAEISFFNGTCLM